MHLSNQPADRLITAFKKGWRKYGVFSIPLIEFPPYQPADRLIISMGYYSIIPLIEFHPY